MFYFTSKLAIKTILSIIFAFMLQISPVFQVHNYDLLTLFFSKLDSDDV